MERTRKTIAVASAAASENSYMLPHGARPAENPRAMTEMRRNPVASHMRDIAMLPARRPGGSGASSSGSVLVNVVVAPAPDTDAALVTSTVLRFALATDSFAASESSCWPRPLAKDAANPRNDPAYTTIEV